MTLRMARTLALGLAAAACLADQAVACPSCKAALASSKGGADLISGFFYSILFMLATPTVLLSCFAGSMYLAVRRAKATGAYRTTEETIAEAKRLAAQRSEPTA
jgi:CBS-domain-containing membrane protein